MDWQGMALFLTALGTFITTIVTLRRTGKIQHEVKTMNEMTLGQLGEASETRRIEGIPEGDRTAREDRHMAMERDDPS